MADFDSQLPVRALATEFTTEVANASGTTINPVEEFAQASTTSGQSGPLIQGAVTTAAPTYTTGQTDPLSLTTTGALRVDGSGSTQPVSGTVTANQGTPNSNANGWPVKITDGTNVLGTGANPVRVDPTGTTTQPISGTVTANAGTGTFQTNMAQVAGTATSVNTGNSDAGTQRVVLATDQPAVSVRDTTVELPQYNTASAVAASASNTQTYSPGSTVSLDGVDASASGQMKVEIQYGTTGAETTKAVFFTSKGNLQLIWRLPHPVTITNTMSVKVIRTNTDNQAMDVYSTIEVH